MQFSPDVPREFMKRADFKGMVHEVNGWFSYVDSAVLYAMVKLRGPEKIVEVGCGVSTGIIRQAYSGELICIDPYPQANIKGLATRHLAAKVETLHPQTFEGTDILFIDSSHVWEAGDLPYLYNQVFPLLDKGTLVHSHDIFLPDDYSPAWTNRHYNEQYHLRAFLKANENWLVIWPGYYMATRHKEEVFDVFDDASSVGSFWMVKC
jgi:predicted O-methyltransferase YrrM